MVMAGSTQLDMGWYKKGVRPIFFSFLQFHSLSSSHALSSLLFFFSGSAMKIPMNLHLLRREMVAGGGWGRRPAVVGGAAAAVNTLFFTSFFVLPLIVLFALVYQLRNHKIEPQLTRSTKKHNTKKTNKKRLPFLSLFESRRCCDSGVVETYGLGCNVLFSSFVLIAVLCVCVVILQVFVNFSVPFCLCLWSDPFSGCFLQVDL